jgi:hypothetical protein
LKLESLLEAISISDNLWWIKENKNWEKPWNRYKIDYIILLFKQKCLTLTIQQRLCLLFAEKVRNIWIRFSSCISCANKKKELYESFFKFSRVISSFNFKEYS